MADDDDLRGLDPDAPPTISRERDQWRAQVAAARTRFSAETLIGMTVSQARAVVEAAGGEFASDDEPIPMKLDANRLVAEVDAGRVVGTSIG